METINFKNMKIAKYLMMLAAAVGIAAACQKEEKVVFDPSVVVAPVLDQIADMVVTEDNMNDKVKFTWTAADFGLDVVVNYTLWTSYADNAEVAVVKSITATETEVALATLNGIFFNDMKIPAGEAKTVKFRLSASLADSEVFYSEAVETNFTAKEAEKTFPPSIYGVVGTLNGWGTPDVNMGDAGEFAHIVDVQLAAVLEALEIADEIKVFVDGHIHIKRGLFGQITDVAFGVDRIFQDVYAVDLGGAGGGGEVTRQNVHRRRFAGAVGPEETDEFTVVDGKRDVVNGFLVAVVLD